MVHEDKACPEFGFDKTRDDFIILIKPVLFLLPGNVNRLFGGSDQGFMKAGPVIFNVHRFWEVHQVSLNGFP